MRRKCNKPHIVANVYKVDPDDVVTHGNEFGLFHLRPGQKAQGIIGMDWFGRDSQPDHDSLFHLDIEINQTKAGYPPTAHRIPSLKLPEPPIKLRKYDSPPVK